MVDGSAVVEILEAHRKKGKRGKKDDESLPGPLIGYLMKKGVIGRKRKKYKKGSVVSKKKYRRGSIRRKE